MYCCRRKGKHGYGTGFYCIITLVAFHRNRMDLRVVDHSEVYHRYDLVVYCLFIRQGSFCLLQKEKYPCKNSSNLYSDD